MISLIIHSYFNIILAVGLVAASALILGIFFIIRKAKCQARTQQDMTAIAGDNIFTTQLDLAKAFIETNNSKSAKKILKTVKRHGSTAQKAEAKHLLSQC